MNEDNIIKKKKKNNNKYYYHQYHNKNKNYYYKNKNKKKKHYVIENTDKNEDNILLFNQKKEVSQVEKVEVEPIVTKIEIPSIETQEVLEKTNLNNEEILPIKKKKKIFGKNVYKYGIGFAILVFALFGVSYSYFMYKRTDPRQANISSGDMYVKLVENATSMTLNKMYPRTDEEARGRDDNYFDFTIKGKNTSETKAILYTININNGEEVSGKNRINPKYIRLDLQEKVNNEYVYIKEGVNLNSYSFQGVIPVNTTNEVTKEYRLRIWINDEIIISDSEANASYTEAEFNNLFANFNISINSEDKVIAYNIFSKNADTETIINFANISSDENGKGLYILPGTENDTYPIYYYRGEVENNNVIFGGFCWQMVRTTDTGGIKMIYNGVATGNGKTCENTLHVDRVLASDVAFNTNSNSVADVGYMNNTRYTYSSTSAAANSVYGKNVKWNSATSNYLVYEDDENTASTNTTKNASHHYTCGTAGDAECNSVRYYYHNNYFITLTDGDTIEDALYKMTGNGDSTIKDRNSNYVLNQNSSMIKTVIENWFEANLTNVSNQNNVDYRSYIEDTTYCNDRSFKTVTGYPNYPNYSESGWNPNGGILTNKMHFGSVNRVWNNWYSTSNIPSLICPNETDRFSVGSQIAHLNYPVGLLTADEMVMAGGAGSNNTSNNTFYLYTGDFYWGMSPFVFGDTIAGNYYVVNSGYVGSNSVSYNNSVRPVISLKLGIEFETGGNGTPTNPYVVKYN